MIDVMKARGSRRLVLSETERKILKTLTQMLPPTAASYEQVLRDIADGRKVSWRGTSAELREVLREVMDHLAPDGDVMAAPGYKLEADLKRPSQKQKVKYILKARHRAVGVAEGTVDTVEEGVAAIARSAYQRGSATTHSTSDAAEVRKLKNAREKCAEAVWQACEYVALRRQRACHGLERRHLAIDQALSRLEQLDPRASRIVELRFFTGLSERERAKALGVSIATVKRDWQFAKAWLFNELRATQQSG